MIRGKNTHFDGEIVDAFLKVPTDFIMNVFLVDVKMALTEADTEILHKYNLLDIYNLIISKDANDYAEEEKTFIETFAKYYEGRSEEEV